MDMLTLIRSVKRSREAPGGQCECPTDILFFFLKGRADIDANKGGWYC